MALDPVPLSARLVRPPTDSVVRDEDESHDLGGVETDVKEIGVQTSLCDESVVERFPSIPI